jgi:peptidoglycan/xylan/chitin deacetylase (PgdA/CDA1 family)
MKLYLILYCTFVVLWQCLTEASPLSQSQVTTIIPTSAQTPVDDVKPITNTLVARQIGSGRRKKSLTSSVIIHCVVPKTIALTFDDGPGPYEGTLLDQLDYLDVKATFFVNGDNHGKIDDPANVAIIRRAYAAGHQIASHTYSHADLTKLDPDGIRQEMARLDDKLKQIIGVRPTYMRPPFGAINHKVLNVLKQLNYRVVLWNVDTNDWRAPDNVDHAIRAMKKQFVNIPSIVLAHSTVPATAHSFVKPVVEYFRSRGYKLVRLDECLGDTSDAYVE